MFLSPQYEPDCRYHHSEGTAGGTGSGTHHLGEGTEAPRLRGSSFTPVSQNQQNQSPGGFTQLTSDPAASRHSRTPAGTPSTPDLSEGQRQQPAAMLEEHWQLTPVGEQLFPKPLLTGNSVLDQ